MGRIARQRKCVTGRETPHRCLLLYSVRQYLQGAGLDRPVPAGKLGDNCHATCLLRRSRHASDLQVRYTISRESTGSPAKGMSNGTRGVADLSYHLEPPAVVPG